MSIYRLWYDTLGSAGGTHIDFKLWLRLLSHSPFRLIPFLYTQIVRGRLINAISRSRNKDSFIPKQVIIEPTYKCNLNCPMCYAKKNEKVIDVDLFEQIVDQSIALGINRFALMGGEPATKDLINKFLPIIKKNKKSFFTFCTNATQLSKEVTLQFKGMNNVSFLISLDGPKNITDQLRGKGTYSIVMNNLKRMAKEKLDVAISMTLTEEKWQEQFSLDFVKELYASGIFIFYTHFIVNDSKIALPDIDKKKLMKHLQKLVKKYPLFINEGYFGKMTPSGIVPRENHQIIIDPEGNVRVDRFNYNSDYGNLNEKSFRQILTDKGLVEYKKNSKREANDYLHDVIDELKQFKFKVLKPKKLF